MNGAPGFDEEMVVRRCLDEHGGNGWIVALRYLWADTVAGCEGERLYDGKGMDEGQRQEEILYDLHRVG